MFIDSHTHLDHTDTDPADLVSDATAAGVGLIIQSGTDLESSRYALSLAERFPQVYCTVGIHPQEAGSMQESDVASLARLVLEPRVVGVGETGFDFYHDKWPHDLQERVFVRQLDLAREADLPVVIHTRDAAARTLEVLARHGEGLKVVLHCFSLPDHLDEVVGRVYYLSFAGNVTYKSAHDLQGAAAAVPLDLLLLETDAPYLTPVPFRGRPNRPGLVPHTYRFVAGLRGMEPEALAEQVQANVGTVFARIGASTPVTP